MIYNLDFQYADCQECAKGSVCAHCQALLEEKLMREQGVAAVEANMTQRRISVEVDDLSLDELKEVLKENGVFEA